MKLRPRRRRWVVYRLYSARGYLLYVGKSYEPRGFDRRLEAHRDRLWGRLIDSWTLTHYPTEEAALEAEDAAIEAERPLFNVAGQEARGRAAERVLAARYAARR